MIIQFLNFEAKYPKIKNFDFWPKFRLLTKISTCDQNFDFRPTFRLSTNISPFGEKNKKSWSKVEILVGKKFYNEKKSFFI